MNFAPLYRILRLIDVRNPPGVKLRESSVQLTDRGALSGAQRDAATACRDQQVGTSLSRVRLYAAVFNTVQLYVRTETIYDTR